MKTTVIKEIRKVELKNPILVEGFPGLGMVGSIATQYLVRQLKAQKLATLYSPNFPYHVLVGNAHVIEEQYGGAAAKPVLYRPESQYVGDYCGPDTCEFVPMDDR